MAGGIEKFKAFVKIDTLCRKHRMAYKRAGEYFRAMKLKELALFGMLQDADSWGLMLPDDGTFASFCDLNADRLQLFDAPKKLVLVRSSGNIDCSQFPYEIEINPTLDKWEYVEELS